GTTLRLGISAQGDPGARVDFAGGAGPIRAGSHGPAFGLDHSCGSALPVSEIWPSVSAGPKLSAGFPAPGYGLDLPALEFTSTPPADQRLARFKTAIC